MKWGSARSAEPGGLACSPDGRWLAVRDDRQIQIWEVASGRRAHAIAGLDAVPRELAFTRDGRGLIVSTGPTPVLWTLRPTQLPSADATDAAWDGLASDDAAAAYRLVWALAADPKAAVAAYRPAGAAGRPGPGPGPVRPARGRAGQPAVRRPRAGRGGADAGRDRGPGRVGAGGPGRGPVRGGADPAGAGAGGPREAGPGPVAAGAGGASAGDGRDGRGDEAVEGVGGRPAGRVSDGRGGRGGQRAWPPAGDGGRSADGDPGLGPVRQGVGGREPGAELGFEPGQAGGHDGGRHAPVRAGEVEDLAVRQFLVAGAG